MQIVVEITDGSDELYELQKIVEEINKESDPTMTIQQYVNNIVNGYFQNRVKKEYIGHAKNLTKEQLKQKLGDFKAIRKGK